PAYLSSPGACHLQPQGAGHGAGHVQRADIPVLVGADADRPDSGDLLLGQSHRIVYQYAGICIRVYLALFAAGGVALPALATAAVSIASSLTACGSLLCFSPVIHAWRIG